jgi:hypothetical protein
MPAAELYFFDNPLHGRTAIILAPIIFGEDNVASEGREQDLTMPQIATSHPESESKVVSEVRD